MSTVVELLTEAHDRADAVLTESFDPAVKREMALAKTAIEDAQMRYTRGLAMHTDRFKPADLEKS